MLRETAQERVARKWSQGVRLVMGRSRGESPQGMEAGRDGGTACDAMVTGWQWIL